MANDETRREGAPSTSADLNWKYFVAFRVFFNARFYYPVFAVMFHDYGLSIGQFTILNIEWAVAIVCLDLPMGALADHIGRRPLVVAAGVCMVIEMALLAFVPLGHPALLFWVFFLNRIMSGAGEACASGADEALVFDSLAEQGREKEWPKVLDEVMRWQSIGLVIAMVTGAAVYDPAVMQKLADFTGMHAHFTQQITMRFPIYLNLVMACVTLFFALRMREPLRRTSHSEQPANPLTLIITGGRWILATPLVMLIIVAGFLNDSVIRLFMTFTSTYYRLIAIPEYTFGILGASLGVLGLAVSPWARMMVEKRSFTFNFRVLVLLTFAGLAGAAFHVRYYGFLLAIPLPIAMYLLGFFISYYINAIVDSSHRATILSFKGLAFNLGYGGVGLLFAGLLQWIKTSRHIAGDEAIFAAAMWWVPCYFAVTVLMLVIAGRRILKRVNIPEVLRR